MPELIEQYKQAPIDTIKPRPIPTLEQIRVGFQAQNEPLSHAYYLFTAVTRLRCGEILGLKNIKRISINLAPMVRSI